MLRVMRDEVPRTRDSKSYYVVQVVVEATHIWLVILVQSGMHYNFFGRILYGGSASQKVLGRSASCWMRAFLIRDSIEDFEM